MMTTTPMGVLIFWSSRPLGTRAIQDSADRVGEGGDILEALGHGGDAFGIESESVQHGGGEAGFFADLEVEGVGLG
jgi:hypothetical protein